MNIAIFEGKKLTNDIIMNDTMSVDEVVASYVSSRYLFLAIFAIFSPILPIFLALIFLASNYKVKKFTLFLSQRFSVEANQI